MANRHRGQASIKMGEQEYTLCFDWDTLAKLREHYGTNYETEITKACLENDTVELARILVIGLRAQNPDLTEESIIKMSPPVLVVGNAIVDALNVAYYGPSGTPPEVGAGESNPLIKRIMETVLKTTLSKRKSSPSEPASTPTNSGG